MQTSHAVAEEPRSKVETLKNYIDGEWRESNSAIKQDVVNPATGEVIAQVPLSTEEEVKQAIAAAQEAFLEWRETPPTKRVRYFFNLKSLLEEHFEELSRIVVQENGKTLDEARGELRRSIEEVECACSAPTFLKGYVLDDISPGVELKAVIEPMGVFCMVPANNFPAMVPLEYMPYAVAAGNTYIVKPSTEVPITQVKIFELIDKAGFPPGVVNLIHGRRDVVNQLLDSPEVKGLSFVGSSPVAKLLYDRACLNGKRAQCAGGAKNHVIVMPDADMDRTVKAMLSSFFGCSGQRCLAGSVAVAVGAAYEPLKAKFVEAASKMRLGYGLEPDTDMGPVISLEHRDHIVKCIEKGLEEGAKLLLDGRGAKVAGYPNGAFLGPTIFDEATVDMSIVQEEIFGPVATIVRAEDLDEAIEIMNKSRFGHSGVIFTNSGHSAKEFAYRAPVGNVGINVGVAATQAFSTLGSIKESFYGDLHGRAESVQFFTERKIVISRWF